MFWIYVTSLLHGGFPRGKTERRLSAVGYNNSDRGLSLVNQEETNTLLIH
jgi:hypothetical protein